MKSKMGRLIFLCIIGPFMLFNVRPAVAHSASGVTVSAPPESGGPVDPAEIESFLDQLFSRQMEEYHLAGVTAAVVKEGEIVFQKGYGYSDVEKKTPVDPAETLFRIGSVTKLFTWTAVLQLVEQGKLDLDADINTYLDFQIPDTFSEPITLKHLMSHTAGFEQHAYEALVLTPDQLPPLGEFLAAHIPARVFPPGQVSVYSDYGVDLAGYIVERVSGMPYNDYMDANILDPLGMAHTTSRQPVPSQLAAGMSNGYRYAMNEYHPAEFELMSAQPSGAMSSTAADMARFMTAHLQGGSLCPDSQGGSTVHCGDILQAPTEQLMQSFLWGTDHGSAGYTYGFFDLQLNGQHILHHGGDTAGFHSLVMLLPDQNLGFFVSYNTTAPNFSWLITLVDFIEHYYPADPAELQPVSASLSPAETYAGGYLPVRGSYTTLEKVDNILNWVEITDAGDGALLLGSPLSPEKVYYEQIEPMLFRESSTGSEIIFQKDDQGQIAYLYDAIFPFASLVKAPWHANPVLHLGLLAFCVLVFLSVFIVGFVGGIVRLFKRGGRAVQPTNVRLARWISILVAMLDLSALIAFLYLNLVTGEFMKVIAYGQVSSINIILAVWLLAAVLTIGLVALTVLVWRKGFWSVAGRIHYTLVTLSAFAFVWFLNYWNLLGFRY